VSGQSAAKGQAAARPVSHSVSSSGEPSRCVHHGLAAQCAFLQCVVLAANVCVCVCAGICLRRPCTCLLHVHIHVLVLVLENARHAPLPPRLLVSLPPPSSRFQTRIAIKLRVVHGKRHRRAARRPGQTPSPARGGDSAPSGIWGCAGSPPWVWTGRPVLKANALRRGYGAEVSAWPYCPKST
jgi:hypothetical protein